MGTTWLTLLGICLAGGDEYYEHYDSLDEGPRRGAPQLATPKGTLALKGSLGTSALRYWGETYLSVNANVQIGGFIADDVLLYGTLGLDIDEMTTQSGTGLGVAYLFSPEHSRLRPTLGGGVGAGKRDEYFGSLTFALVWFEGGAFVPLTDSLALNVGGSARLIALDGERMLLFPTGISLTGFL